MSAALPCPEFTDEERDNIVATFGGTDAYLSVFAEWLREQLQQRAYATAKVAADVQVAQAVQTAMDALPASLSGDPQE